MIAVYITGIICSALMFEGFLNYLIIRKSLRDYKTCELVEELKTREGVTTQWAEPDSKIEINETGPAVVMVITD